MEAGRTMVASGNSFKTDFSPKYFVFKYSDEESGLAFKADTWISFVTPASLHNLAILSAPFTLT